MRVLEFERDATVAVLFEHAFHIVHVDPLHIAREAQESLLLGILSESCDTKGGSRLEKPFINRCQSHLRQPDLTQREVPCNLFGEMSNHGLLLGSCCPQAKVEFNAQKQLSPKLRFDLHVFCVVIIC